MTSIPKSKFDHKTDEWINQIERDKAHEDATTGCEVIHPLVMDVLEAWDENKIDAQSPVIAQSVTCLSTEVLIAFRDHFTVDNSGKELIILVTPDVLQALAVFAIQAGYEVMPQMEERWAKRDQ